MLLFLQNNIWTVLIALTSGAMLFWSFFGNRLRGIQEIDSIAATQLINHKNALVLDVREQSEYDAGHILNSKLIPAGKLLERIGELRVAETGEHAGGARRFDDRAHHALQFFEGLRA